MPPPAPEQLSRTIETLYRSESGRVLATLVRLLGDLDLADEAMHEALAWARKGAISCDALGEVRELLFFPAPEQGPSGSN